MAGEEQSLSIEPESVKALGRTALDIAALCRDGLAALELDVRDVRDSWSGNNSDAFIAGWDEFHQGAVEVWDALMELAAKLGVTAETLQDTDVPPGDLCSTVFVNSTNF
ncbi:WXG100 family type VII secretion target [Nocardia wallacei]|uniref:WXG100 family type VII secretion target n=1 Tax=Nocardia wallacei TaxID=480035 RepID=UPI002459116D|nr:WXG100 family type VII secretion target [Nocardia wallacei]